MPAFIKNGPEIPERLLQAHEEDNVVFFCGAGISYPAKLPGFGGLVNQLINRLGITLNDVQKTAIKTQQYDTVIGLIESDIKSGRNGVRTQISKILTPDLKTPNATATHEALLDLARCRKNNSYRLVTTNFDRIFETVVLQKNPDIQRFIAPLLPIPKKQWDGLVYLHGLIPNNPTSQDLDRLVVSSGDFGLAYLVDRWAARFVSELFRNFTVCFVGYSLNDPVLRYMTDALGADRLLGETPNEMFAFGNYPRGKEDQIADEWKAKNVTPILYRNFKRHFYLRRTLQAWAEVYRTGAHGKSRIILRHAQNPPPSTSKTDFIVGRVLWALTDISAAKKFAALTPPPPLEWLEPLSESQFGYRDLIRFGVTPQAKSQDNVSFSMVYRPASYNKTPRMCLVDIGPRYTEWDPIMEYLATWLLRHLGDIKLVRWVAKNGGRLHDRFYILIRSKLDELHRLQKAGEQDRLKEIENESPKAIPDPNMRTLWNVILSKRLKSAGRQPDLLNWAKRFDQEGMTSTLRMELRELLSPRVILREPYVLPPEEEDQ